MVSALEGSRMTLEDLSELVRRHGGLLTIHQVEIPAAGFIAMMQEVLAPQEGARQRPKDRIAARLGARIRGFPKMAAPKKRRGRPPGSKNKAKKP